MAVDPEIQAPPTTDVKPPRKRRRLVMSCTECHRRKQKCDRLQPCSNCCSRNKQSACDYEVNHGLLSRQGPRNEPHINGDPKNGNAAASTSSSESGGSHAEATPTTDLSALGYSKTGQSNTMGIIKRIQDATGDNGDTTNGPAVSWGSLSGVREKYKSLLRQLPPRPQQVKLVDNFFEDVNPQYSSVDPAVFKHLFNKWGELPFSIINKGPQELPSDLRFFPALLFQILASALQFQPLDHDKDLDSLKYVAGMDFDDLALDYSDSGVAILHLLGKHDLSIVSVQAGLLRASFLKNNGMVNESWHCIGQTIRDAQEIGLDKDISAMGHPNGSSGEALDWLWQLEIRRRLWIILQTWDIHMAICLSRPTSIPFDCTTTLPVDCPVAKNHREIPPLPRSTTDPPTALTLLLWNYQLSLPLKDIILLEREGSYPRDYRVIEKLQENFTQRALSIPAWLRLDNPDTQFDAQCRWLPRGRHILQTTISLFSMALHKPYIFTIPRSRTQALHAALKILDTQQASFKFYSRRDYKMFSLVLTTFDAIVLVAAVFILYPHEHPELLNCAIQHFNWAVERMEALSSRSEMARSALGVLRAIHVRLKKAVNTVNAVNANMFENPAVRAEVFPATNGTESTKGTNTDNQRNGTEKPQVPNGAEPPEKPEPETPQVQETVPIPNGDTANVALNPKGALLSLGPPLDFDFNSMPPLNPYHDLLDNSLVGMESEVGTGLQDGLQGFGDLGNWHFQGDFQDDSFWSLMNSYNL